MPRLWAGATFQERHQLLTMILDAVYIDMKYKKSIVSMKAKPAFQAVLGVGAQASLGFRINDEFTCVMSPTTVGP